jgi:N-acetylneuraminic acid mutarotase
MILGVRKQCDAVTCDIPLARRAAAASTCFCLSLVILGCHVAAQPSPDVFATQGTGAWQALPALPAGRTVGGDAELIWTGNFALALAPGQGGFPEFDPVAQAWRILSTNGSYPSGSGGAVVWTGQAVLVFGGSCGIQGTCAITESINAATGQSTNLSLVNAPAVRAFGTTAVWTGTQMIVWGGYAISVTENVAYGSGALYDPMADTWTSMSPAPGAKSAYINNSAVWTGTQMLVWGGEQLVPGTFSDATPAPSGLAYDPGSDTWTALPTDGQPSSRATHVAVWTGTEMLIWGGAPFVGDAVGNVDATHPLSDGAAYNPVTRTWRPLQAPATGLVGAASVWTGTEMLVWGGYAEYSCGEDCPGSNLGYRYNPVSDRWQYITSVNAPSPRTGMGAAWTGQSLIIWGGVEAIADARDGAQWTP